MNIKDITPRLSVSSQIAVEDIARIADLGFRTLINNRPDKESDDQPLSLQLAEEAKRHNLQYRHMPVIAGKIGYDDVEDHAEALATLPGPVLAFCRTGTRSITLWAVHEASTADVDGIVGIVANAGFEVEALRPRLQAVANGAVVAPTKAQSHAYDVVIVGGGSAGIATAASLLRRRSSLDIAVVEPRERHYYQPGFTLAGRGVYDQSRLVSETVDVMPAGVKWIRSAAAAFEPDKNRVILEGGDRLSYRQLVVAPGIKLDWDAIPGLRESLGWNGVTSNYRRDLTRYTWEQVQQLREGRAVFTQAPMPIKCAGAPQKAMYLSCDYWLRESVLNNLTVDFFNAGDVLFGVNTYVPALMEYVKKYGANLNFSQNLVEIDGAARKAWFDQTNADGSKSRNEVEFDFIHVCPPQTAPDFIRNSPLAGASGWIDVSPETLRHQHFDNIFGLGDACSAPNAKTMAAARKQAPVVAENVIAALADKEPSAAYDGYGSCPLTVEAGKVVLAEFGYNGTLLPSFPKWLNDGTRPTRFAWRLKARYLPAIYYQLMLKGREWLAAPQKLDAA